MCVCLIKTRFYNRQIVDSSWFSLSFFLKKKGKPGGAAAAGQFWTNDRNETSFHSLSIFFFLAASSCFHCVRFSSTVWSKKSCKQFESVFLASLLRLFLCRGREKIFLNSIALLASICVTQVRLLTWFYLCLCSGSFDMSMYRPIEKNDIKKSLDQTLMCHSLPSPLPRRCEGIPNVSRPSQDRFLLSPAIWTVGATQWKRKRRFFLGGV